MDGKKLDSISEELKRRMDTEEDIDFAALIRQKKEEAKISERDQMRMWNAFSIVSSLSMMTVIDVMLAYWGGDWLDKYFRTGTHICRQVCLGLAGLAFVFSIVHLVSINMYKDDDSPFKKKRRHMAAINADKSVEEAPQQDTEQAAVAEATDAAENVGSEHNKAITAKLTEDDI